MLVSITGQKFGRAFAEKPIVMKKPFGYDEVLIQLAVANKASLQRLAKLIEKLEASARRDAFVSR